MDELSGVVALCFVLFIGIGMIAWALFSRPRDVIE